LKYSAKISENQENSAETYQRRRRNSENREHQNVADFTDKSVGLTDKSTVFLKTGMASSGRFLPETGRFLLKFYKWNEKAVKTMT
jgi:hypothetical protein